MATKIACSLFLVAKMLHTKNQLPGSNSLGNMGYIVVYTVAMATLKPLLSWQPKFFIHFLWC